MKVSLFQPSSYRRGLFPVPGSDDADRLRRRYSHQEGYEVRQAYRRDPQRDYLFDLAGGALMIAVVVLGCLVIATQALNFIARHH